MEEMSKRTTQDRISTLPDCLLHQILSSLNMEEVVKTSVLSKRWKYIWTSVPTLTFTYYDSTEEGMAVFVAWVSRVILHFQNTSCVEKFELRCPYDSAYDTDFDMWARFVTNKKVKDLRLQFHTPEWFEYVENVSYSNCHGLYTLPKDVFCNSSLTKLWASGCKVVSYGDFRLTCLKKISFVRVHLENDIIAEILSASPMLVYLKIFDCSVPSQLVINSESLKGLVIARNYTDSDGELTMEISAPGLLSFSLFGDFDHLNNKNHPLISMASLRRAKLCYFYYDGDEGVVDDDDDNDNDDDEGHGFEIKRVIYLGELLLERLKRVVKLEMGFHCIQTMLFLEAKGLQSPLLCLKCLELHAKINRNNIPGIVTLFKCSPNLEKLVVNQSIHSKERKESLSFPKFRKKVESYWMCKGLMEEVPLPHLKTVKFIHYKKWEDVDEITHTFIQLLFKNAPLLPEVVINVAGHERIVTRHLA